MQKNLGGLARFKKNRQVRAKAEILRRIHAGLCAAESGVSAGEASWITIRLAELLNWPLPEWATAPDA